MARTGYSDAAAAAFQASRELPPDALSEWRAAISRHLAPRPGMRVLDLGAGTGTWATALASWYGISVVAVEPSPAMRAGSAGRARSPGMPPHSRSAPRPWTAPGCPPSSTNCPIFPPPPASSAECSSPAPPCSSAAPSPAATAASAVPLLARGHRSPGHLPHHRQRAHRFAAAGLSYVALEPVRQVTAPSLAAIAATTGREARTPLMLITDNAYQAGLARLRAAAATQQGTVTDTLDLLVFRAARATATAQPFSVKLPCAADCRARCAALLSCHPLCQAIEL